MRDFKFKKVISSLLFVICFMCVFSTVAYADEFDTDIEERINVSVVFKWNDNDDILAIRPARMIAKLYANGDFTSKRVIVENRTWQATFEDLPMYDEEDQIIEYTVTQQYLPNMNTTYEYTYVDTVYDINTKTYIITNKYIEERLLEQEEIHVDDKANIYRDPVKQDEVHVETDEKQLQEYHTGNWEDDGISKYDNTPQTSDVYDILKYIYILLISAMALLIMYIHKKDIYNM